MTAITGIFVVVVGAAITSILIGFHEAFIYLIKNSKRTDRAKKKLTRLCNVVYFLLSIVAIFGVVNWDKLLTQTLVGNYVAVIVYTLLLGLLSADALYISPSMEINSVFKAFRRGFTKGNVNSIIPKLYIKTLINLFYLIILILAQIEDLKLATLPSGLSYFCTLNKYGIVIVFAVEKIIKSVAAEKKRKRILTETFIEQEKQDEKDREETRRLMREVKELFKQRRAEKKLARQKRKQAKENSKGKNKK